MEIKYRKSIIHQVVDGVEMDTEVLLPDFEVPQETRPIGKWGMMRRTYLKEAKPFLWTDLVLTGKLFTHLADINEQATDRFHLIMRQMMEAEGVTEELKRTDQMEWVRSVNSIANRAEEIIMQELIYC